MEMPPAAVRQNNHTLGARLIALIAAVFCFAAVLAGCEDATSPEPAASASQTEQTEQTDRFDDVAAEPDPAGEADRPDNAPPVIDEPTVSEALAALASLQTKGRAPKTGYDRDAFAYRSFDLDRNGCDARNDILRRDLRKITIQRGTGDCVVLTGVLDDPYSGETIRFNRGAATSADVQIDHVVALSDAWQKGAQSWKSDKLKRFGNDPLNLLAVDGPLNNQKGDGDAATWLPPNRAYRCDYVARQIAVKKEYGLWVTKAERRAMKDVLSDCENQRLPKDVTTPKSDKVKYAKAPQKSASKAETETSPEPVKTSTYFKNCTAVRAAGAAPVYSTDPGYGRHLDRDGDGVGCE
ncbi:Excalibur calcium-binding domain-containing protein [Micrococcales bacterium KH10]|nr:Excalibur calcium-binding domain-containing protein [Micrococcales bacterium KH10]